MKFIIVTIFIFSVSNVYGQDSIGLMFGVPTKFKYKDKYSEVILSSQNFSGIEYSRVNWSDLLTTGYEYRFYESTGKKGSIEHRFESKDFMFKIGARSYFEASKKLTINPQLILGLGSGQYYFLENNIESEKSKSNTITHLIYGLSLAGMYSTKKYYTKLGYRQLFTKFETEFRDGSTGEILEMQEYSNCSGPL